MKEFIDWNAIGTYLLPILSAVAGWLSGRKKTKNDFLKDLQSSIDLLSEKNTALMKEVIGLRQENAQLLAKQTKLEIRINVLTEQNHSLKVEVERLNEQLANVKTITRKA